MSTACKPVLIFDLDETLFHTNHKDITSSTPRPYLKECLETLSVNYELFVFTLGTHEYAEEKCAKFGILDNIPLKRIYSREDSTIQGENHYKILDTILYDCCPSCASNVVIVDDTPEVWQTSYGNAAQVIEWEHILNNVPEITSKSVIRIPRFYGDEKDTALSDLTVFMRSCDIVS
jgi:hypothetical protein